MASQSLSCSIINLFNPLKVPVGSKVSRVGLGESQVRCMSSEFATQPETQLSRVGNKTAV